MKQTTLGMAMMAAMLCLTGFASAQNCEPGSGQAALFEHANYQGKCVVRGAGSYSTIASMGIANDAVSSIKVGPNASIRICEHTEFQGRCSTVTGNVSFLGSNSVGNDQVSSYQVIATGGGGVSTGTGSPPSSVGQRCASEGGRCSFSGSATVWYGAGNRGTSRTATNGINCDNGTFGDPAPGVVKACYVSGITRPTPAPTPRPIQPPVITPTSSFGQKCADEGGRCSFNGSATVWYGAGNKGTSRTATNGINCDNGTFGDPIPGVAKACYVSGITSTGGGPQPPIINPGPPNNPAAPALSKGDMNQVMKWIAVRTSALRLPFCWRDSYSRGTGRAADCPSEYTNMGITCLREASTYSAPSRLADCPAGYKNMGTYCGKGILPWEISTKSLDSATCPSGYFKGVAGRCYKNCRPGYTNNGEFCGKGASTLSMDSMKCRPGEVRQGAFCYPPCKNGYNGVTALCTQSCPRQQPTDCALGCATTSGECRSAVFDMVSSTVMLAVNIASVGQAASVTYPAKAAKIAASASKMERAVNGVKRAMKVAGDVGDIYTIASSVNDQVDLFATEFSDNFEVWTSPEIAAEIDRNFSPLAAQQVKRQWGMRHLTLMLEADGLATAKNVMSVVGVFDPTGVVDVVNAYTHPICRPDSPFPRVRANY